MSSKGFLGIDAGTQGLSVVVTDEELKVVATAESTYEMLPNLESGCYEQSPNDWLTALKLAMQSIRTKIPDLEILCVGISGQMHGEVMSDAKGQSMGSVRLWCDSRNESEGHELTERFAVKMPKRITSARWLWTIRNQPEKAQQTAHLTTPSGWLAFMLTGQWTLGIGDAAGMFPIDQGTKTYDERLLRSFDDLVNEQDINTNITSLKSLLPEVRKAGEDAGALNESGSQILGLPVGIPVAAAEGDQPASMAGSLIGEAGMASVSFGTSVCANSVGDRAFSGVSNAVDHFCAPDGKPINMVWLRNGTTFMNTVVEMFGSAGGGDCSSGFEQIMPQVLMADADCGGLLALPFMDDEPGLGVARGGTAMLIGLAPENSTPGNAVKAAILSTMFNLKLGSEILDQQGYPRTELVLAGGLTRTPELGQILADVFDTKVTLLESAEEGTAWGAAVLAKYRHTIIDGEKHEWSEFLNGLAPESKTQFNPLSANVIKYESVYKRYKSLLELHQTLQQAVCN